MISAIDADRDDDTVLTVAAIDDEFVFTLASIDAEKVPIPTVVVVEPSNVKLSTAVPFDKVPNTLDAVEAKSEADKFTFIVSFFLLVNDIVNNPLAVRDDNEALTIKLPVSVCVAEEVSGKFISKVVPSPFVKDCVKPLIDAVIRADEDSIAKDELIA